MGKENGYAMSFGHELNSLFFKITISYLLYFWFFPLKNKLKYLPLVFGIFSINILTYYYTDNLFHPGHDEYWTHFTSSALTYTAFGIVFYVIYALKKEYYSELKINQLEKEKRISEINALKANINPHFLFNTLNMIYANAIKKDEKTADLILKLSDNFRYLFHEGQHQFVPIYKDIEHLKSYIALQKERLTKKVFVNFEENIDTNSQQISPLLLISFVENAFKYTSILKGENYTINITIRLKNNELYFYCENPYALKASENIDTNWKESGIGISSTKARLNILYPKGHSLSIIEKNSLFMVTLNISL
ncbi:signaling protein without kinase domain [Flavobacteriales bacterium ALC-1]|nr:signaling protein without kinase domain [Flavobacteriales bacterium ALC-1]